MVRLVQSFARDEGGATAIEYGMIAGLVSLAILTAIQHMGQTLEQIFTSIKNGLAT
jgi:pilus assembly protein Flp/PilA